MCEHTHNRSPQKGKETAMNPKRFLLTTVGSIMRRMSSITTIIIIIQEHNNTNNNVKCLCFSKLSNKYLFYAKQVWQTSAFFSRQLQFHTYQYQLQWRIICKVTSCCRTQTLRWVPRTQKLRSRPLRIQSYNSSLYEPGCRSEYRCACILRLLPEILPCRVIQLHFFQILRSNFSKHNCDV